VLVAGSPLEVASYNRRKPRMDYDATEIPAVYDLSRDHGPAVADLWMSEVAKHIDQSSIERILDLGCGTGRFSNALASRFQAGLIAIDP
jgi:ubiquinone/menaquinone biosynthesis C-methylase UbiE